jgi:flagellar biosynthesis protein FlhF
MKVKTYKSPSLQQGLENIKRDLGSEALILSTRSVSARPRFGLFRKPAWEIMAAVQDKKGKPQEKPAFNADTEKPASESSPDTTSITRRGGLIDEKGLTPFSLLPPQVRREARARQGEALRTGAPVSSTAAAAPTLAPVPAPLRDQRMDTLIDEIAELKKSFRTLSKTIPVNAESGGGLFAELVSRGIDHDLADYFVSTASYGKPDHSELRERVRGLIANQLIIAPAAELHAKARVVTAFVGSTGVGKTTTIAKIAGHASIRMKKKVAMISTDMFRVGGQEQLNRFGELLGIPTYGCADVATLKDLVASLSDRDLILIDTPGSSPSDLARLSKLETVTSAADAKVHLVISATTRSEDITKIVIRFQRFRPHSVIFTKVDETESKVPLTGDLLRNEIPVSYVTDGQRVPEDLIIPSADELARHVLPLEPTA